jgi:hypothetical protein
VVKAFPEHRLTQRFVLGIELADSRASTDRSRNRRGYVLREPHEVEERIPA